MKYRILKKVSFGLILIFSIMFSACGLQNFIVKHSKNVNEYTINAVLNSAEKTLSCNQTTKFVNKTATTIDEVSFHLYPNSFSELATQTPVSKLYESKAYPNGKSYGKLELSNVKIGDNILNYTLEGLDKTILTVKLEKNLFPDEKIEIEMDYVVTLPNVSHRFGYGENAINLANFYPIVCAYDNGFCKTEYCSNGDPFYSDMANYNVSLTRDKKLTLASTGDLVETSEKDELVTTKYVAKAVRDFAMVLSEKFNVLTKKVDDVTTVNYYYYNDKQPEKSIDVCVDSVKTFKKQFGDYPYSSLAVVETNFLYGGMEYPNLVMISDNLDLYTDYIHTIVHEIAHQWWYGMVGNDEWNYGWLDEGLTEYSTIIFYEQNPQYNMDPDTMLNNSLSSFTMFVDVYNDVFGNVDTTMNRPLDKFKTEPEYVYIAYIKGMLLFDTLRDVLGDKSFFKCLKAYFKEYAGQNAKPDDLISVFEKTSLRNLEKFFDSWINGKVILSTN